MFFFSRRWPELTCHVFFVGFCRFGRNYRVMFFSRPPAKNHNVMIFRGSAKKKNTERSIEPPSGKANWLMVRAPHLKQRDAEWSATTGTTKVVGGAMADGRESGAPEGPSPEHEPPPVFCLLFSLSRQAPPSGDSGDLGQKGGTAWGGWDAGRARGTSTLVLRPRSPPRRRRRRRLELSLSFFFFPWRV